MSEPKTKRISIEEHVDGDRLAQTANDGKQMLAMIAKCRKIAKYAENGVLKLNAEAIAHELTCLAILYGFIDAEETTNDDAEPTVTDALKTQSPGVTDDE